MPGSADKLKIMNNYEALVWLVDIGADEAIEAQPVTNRRGTGDNQRLVAGAHWPVASNQREVSSLSYPTQAGGVIGEAQTGGTKNHAGGSSDHPIIRTPLAESALAETLKLAEAATTLPELYDAIRRFKGCDLRKTAANTVIGDGNPASSLMLIGEAPGVEEDKAGIPFCDASGQLLTTMLGFIGLNRLNDYYVTNVCFWRPPGNRPPTGAEIALCRPLVERHIALVNPKRLCYWVGSRPKPFSRTRWASPNCAVRYFLIRITLWIAQYQPMQSIAPPTCSGNPRPKNKPGAIYWP